MEAKEEAVRVAVRVVAQAARAVLREAVGSVLVTGVGG